MTERTFVNAVGVFRVTDEGSVVQVEGKPVARPVEYVLSQYLAGILVCSSGSCAYSNLFCPNGCLEHVEADVCCGDPADCANCG